MVSLCSPARLALQQADPVNTGLRIAPVVLGLRLRCYVAIIMFVPAQHTIVCRHQTNTGLRFFISPVPRPAIQGPEFLQGSALRCNSRFYIPERFLFLSALQAHYHLVLEPGFLFLQTP